MFERSKHLASAVWKRYRRFSLFIQILFVVPMICAVALTLLVGNMGLALLGTAVALNSLVVGWVGGAAIIILGKAGIIIAKDRKKTN